MRFSVPEGVESEQSIEQKETLWFNSLMKEIVKVKLRGTEGLKPGHGAEWVTLHVFTLISGKVSISSVALVTMNGGFLPMPYLLHVDNPANGQIQEKRFGVIDALNDSIMNEQEREPYENLINVQEPKASTVDELKTLVLSLEQLGSEVDARIAVHETAWIGGPFSSATLDESQQRWLTYPEGPCLTILPHSTPTAPHLPGIPSFPAFHTYP